VIAEMGERNAAAIVALGPAPIEREGRVEGRDRAAIVLHLHGAKCERFVHAHVFGRQIGRALIVLERKLQMAGLLHTVRAHQEQARMTHAFADRSVRDLIGFRPVALEDCGLDVVGGAERRVFEIRRCFGRHIYSAG